MIVKMVKLLIASSAVDRDRLLSVLRDLGVIHIIPVDPKAAVADEKTKAHLDVISRAVQHLHQCEPAGQAPDLATDQAATETLTILRQSVEGQNRLAALYRHIQQIEIWGDVRLEDIDALNQAGVEPKFYLVPTKDLAEIQAEFICELTSKNKKGQTLVALVNRDEEVALPEFAEALELPTKDRPTLRAEAAEVDAALKADNAELAKLANLLPALEAEHDRLQSHSDFVVATNSGLHEGQLYAIQGWAPAEKAETLAEDLESAGIQVAVEIIEPGENEYPPTLIKYPRWAKPIKGLFDILGTVAGYREKDVGAPFMLALPIFAAMLIGDGGYGLLLLLLPLIFPKKAAKLFGKDFSRLLMVIGGTTFIWGLLSASFFGVLLYTPLIPVNMTDESRSLIMRISFMMGAIHLSGAKLWQGISFWPSLKAIGCLGWALFIWGMLGVVQYYVLNDPVNMSTPWPYLLMAGGALAIIFDSPSRNPFKMVATGIANFPLAMLSAFSDIISYVRLMAVGLASGVLATNFNELAASTDNWFLGVPVLIFGHGLNIGLALIALFAHGVRLNMLEFSNNLGMQWTGMEYEPFAKRAMETVEK